MNNNNRKKKSCAEIVYLKYKTQILHETESFHQTFHSIIFIFLPIKPFIVWFSSLFLKKKTKLNKNAMLKKYVLLGYSTRTQMQTTFLLYGFLCIHCQNIVEMGGLMCVQW